MALLIGADPEFFLRKGSRNVSAHGLCPGTKKEPHKIDKGAVQLDGTAVEFNIDPASTSVAFAANIKKVMEGVREIIPKNFKFHIKPSVKYGKDYFDKEIPADCKVLGCDPDFDAYKNGGRNDPPQPVSTIRTGAGHVHIGWGTAFKTDDPSHIADCVMLTRNMDAIVRMVEHNWDKDNRRRLMYGKLGTFRPKPYGVEYRSLSNAWVNYPKLYKSIFDMALCAYKQTAMGIDLQYTLLESKLSINDFNRVMTRLRYEYGGQSVNIPPDFMKETVKW